MSNYATKTELRNAAGVDLDNLKSNADKLDIYKLKNVLTNLSNLISEVDKLDVNKIALVTVDLKKLSDVVKNDVVNKDLYSTKIKNIEDKIPNITNLATNASFNANAKVNKAKSEIPSITNLATSASLNAKIKRLKLKYPILLTSENFIARLGQSHLASKNDIASFVKKISFHEKIKTISSKAISTK